MKVRLQGPQVLVSNKGQKTEAYFKSSFYSPGNHMDPSNTEQKTIDTVIEDSGLETVFLSLDCTYIYIHAHILLS